MIDSTSRLLAILLSAAFVYPAISSGEAAGAEREITAAGALAPAESNDLAMELAQAWMAQVPAESMAWNWEEAVLAIGMQAIHQDTGDAELLEYLRSWVDFHMARGIRVSRNDAVVPCTSALYLYDITGENEYLDPVSLCSDYLAYDAPRLSDGAIAHTTATPSQVWVDSLFMFGTFYTMTGEILDASTFDEVSHQFELFEDHLFSYADHLYLHMYDEKLDRNVPNSTTYWGRGNGWAFASMAMLLTALPDDHPERAAMESLFLQQADAVMDWQQDTGLWATVVNRPEDTYQETSATGLFSFALLRGYRLGLLDARALGAGQAGLEGLLSRIVYDEAGYPVVTGISAATNPGPYFIYAHIPQTEDEPFGIGAVMLALEEGSRAGISSLQ